MMRVVSCASSDTNDSEYCKQNIIMNKTGKNAKADVADKVKEIKQRQQSWLKQREREKSSTQNDSRNQTLSPESKPRTTTSPVAQSYPPKRPPMVGKTQVISEGHGDDPHGSDPHAKAGFQTWLAARQTESNNFIVRQDMAKNSEFNGAPPLEEDMFGTAAERIAARVKTEMRLEERQEGDGNSSSSNHTDNLTMSSGSGLESHRCRLCNKVMVAPDHSPTLLIPCGHTYCMRCVNDQSRCPECKCSIQSMTNNIMLEQIIMEYARKARDSIGSHSSMSSFRSTPKMPEKDYAAEYQQLGLRCEVLRAESDDIQSNMRDLDNQVHQQEKQMQSIDRQESRLQAEIEEIQQRIGQLRLHKRDFEDRIGVIQGHKEQEAERFKMVKATISQLSQDMIKAKSMAQKLNQNIT